MDLRGHGKSGGKTAQIPSVNVLADDMYEYHKKIKNIYGNEKKSPPMYIFAHSLGA